MVQTTYHSIEEDEINLLVKELGRYISPLQRNSSISPSHGSFFSFRFFVVVAIAFLTEFGEGK
jgi:hypothetical protein